MPEPTPTVYPLAGHQVGKDKITTPFGGAQANSNGYNVGSVHKGQDIAVPAGTPVLSTVAGKVVRAGWDNSGFGNLVVVQDAAGNQHFYGHLSALVENIKPGATVDAGQHLGAVGSTGNSTGPHLHYQVNNRAGTAVDPGPWLRGETVAEPSSVDPKALADASKARYDDLQKQLTDARALIARVQGATDIKALAPADRLAYDNLTTKNGLTELETAATNALRVWEVALGASQGKELTAEQKSLLTAQAAQANAQAARLEKEAKDAGDPSSADNQQKLAQAANLRASAKETEQLVGVRGALLSAQAGQAAASGTASLASAQQSLAQAGQIAALTPGMVQQLLADAGVKEADRQRILALIQPQVDSLNAGTAKTQAEAQEIRLLMGDKLRQQQSNINLTDAQVTKLLDDVTTAGVQRGLIQAQTGLTGAQTGLTNAQSRVQELTALAEQRRMEAWDKHVAPLFADPSRPPSPQQVQEALTAAVTTAKEGLDLLTLQESQRANAEAERSNRSREVLQSDTNRVSQQQADVAQREAAENAIVNRTNARTNQQVAATSALTDYARFGVASAPFMSNVLGAQAPLLGDERAIGEAGRQMGVGQSILDGVLAGFRQFQAGQQQREGALPGVRRADLQFDPAAQGLGVTPGAPSAPAPVATGAPAPPVTMASAIGSAANMPAVDWAAQRAQDAAAMANASPLVQALLRRRSGV